MSGGALANMLGMGVTVQLLDMFTSTSQQVSKSSNKLASDLTRDAHGTSNAWNGMFVGGALAASGLGVLKVVADLGKKSLESSSQLEIFRNQFHVMIKDYQWAEKVYNDSIQFAAKTPFTIPEVVGAAKTLRAFGFQAHQIGGELQVAGDWAAMFGERIEKTSEILGRAMAGGYGRALVYMRGRGINDKDIQQAARDQGTYNMLFDASGKTKRGYDGNMMVNAMNQVIQSRYGGEMVKRMTTIPGMVSNIQDQMILLMSTIGDQFKPRLKSLMGMILKDLGGDSMKNLGKALGQGFDVLIRVLGAVVTPLHKVVIYLGDLSEKHPAFVKWAVVIVAAAGALIFLTGTWLVWIAAAKLWEMSGIVGQFANAQKAVMAFATGPLLTLIVVAAMLYYMWKYNFGGMQETLKKWWNVSKLVFQAVTEGFGSISNGVITFSNETYEALEKAGVASWVINVMAFLYRLYRIVVGAVEGFMQFTNEVGLLAAALWWLVKPIMWLIGKGAELIGWMTGLGDAAPADTYQQFGRVLGWVVGIMVALRVWTAATAIAIAIWRAVTVAATLAGWAWTAVSMVMQAAGMILTGSFGMATTAATGFAAALWANPITWIVAAVLALIVGIGILIWKWKEISNWFKGMPMWAQIALVVLMPFVFLPMMIMNNWGKLKGWFSQFATWFKDMWGSTIDWVFDKIATMMAFFVRMMVKMTQMLPSWMKPEALKALDNIDADKIDGKFVRNFASNAIDGMRQARLNGANPLGAYMSGVEANRELTNSVLRRPQAPVQTTTILQLDGRTIARNVTMHQVEEAATGRTF